MTPAPATASGGTAGSPFGTEETHAAVSRRQVVAVGLAAVLSPLALLLVNRDWFLTSGRDLEAWRYVGFFLFYDLPSMMPGASPLGGLPWVLSGYGLHHLVSPVAASVVLHGAYLMLATGALFAGVWWAFRDLLVAFLAAVALGFFAHFHGSGGWDYHNTPAGAFYLVTVALVQTAVWFARRRPLALLGAGTTMTLALYCNLRFVNLLPFLAAQYFLLVVHREGRAVARGRARRDFLWVLAGAVFVTVAVGAVHVWLGRGARFFQPLVSIVATSVPDVTRSAWSWQPWGSLWFLRSGDLALPAAVLLASTWVLVFRRDLPGEDGGRRLAARLMVGQYVALCLLWIVWQALGYTALQPRAFAYPLIPACFLALGAILYLYRREHSTPGAVFVASLTVAAMFLALALGAGESSAAVAARRVLGFAALIPFILALGALATVMFKGLLSGLALGGVLLSLANAVGANAPAKYSMTDPCRFGPDVFRSVVTASQLIRGVDPGFDRSRIWFQEGETFQLRAGCSLDMGEVVGAIAATGWPPLVRTGPMPGIAELPEHTARDVARNRRLLTIITGNEDNVRAMESRFSALGYGLRLRRQERVDNGDIAFLLYALEGREEGPPRDLRPGPILLEITGKRLLGAFELNVFGGKPPQSVLVPSGGAVLFEPTTTQDHLALPFVALPVVDAARSPGQARQLMITASVAPSSSSPSVCQIVVQDQSLSVLETFACPDAARPTTTAYVVAPPTTRKVRVYLVSPTLAPSPIPETIRVVEMVPLEARAPAGR